MVIIYTCPRFATPSAARVRRPAALAIAVHASRRGPHGRSPTTGIATRLGALAPTLLFGAPEDPPFILGLLCSVFDLACTGLLLRGPRAPVRSPPAPSR